MRGKRRGEKPLVGEVKRERRPEGWNGREKLTWGEKGREKQESGTFHREKGRRSIVLQCGKVIERRKSNRSVQKRGGRERLSGVRGEKGNQSI